MNAIKQVPKARRVRKFDFTDTRGFYQLEDAGSVSEVPLLFLIERRVQWEKSASRGAGPCGARPSTTVESSRIKVPD
jgi:hypothetical protein